MGKDDKHCPKCDAVLLFRLGGYESPDCGYELRGQEVPQKAAPVESYGTDASQLESLLRGLPPTRELGDPAPLRRRQR